jgi:hypothetical protein
MASTVCTLDGLNLNDRVTYWLMPGFDPGDAPLTFDAFVSYNGTAVQRNVVRAGIVEMTLPIDVRSATETGLLAAIEAINAKIRDATNDLPKILVVGARTYSVVSSPEISPQADDLWYSGIARLSITLNRRA